LDGEILSEVAEVDYVAGCALLARRQVIERIGLLDPRFFYSWEDVDLCYRARREGYQCLFVPQAKVWHKVNTALGGKTPTYWYYMTRNNLLWLEKHHDLVRSDRPYWHFTKRILWCLYHVDLPSRDDRWRKRHAVLLGLRDYALRRFGDASR
jgi:GT2 family glycosyltransferase